VKQIITILFVVISTIAVCQDWKLKDVERFETFDAFEQLLNLDTDTTYLINFWATWCGPCVQELPYIDGLVENYKSSKFKSILVSLDFKNQIESRLLPFLNKNNIQSEVVVLLDGKSSKWIDRVDPNWSGSIPFTIIYNKNKRQFFEKQFHTLDELVELVDPFLNNKN